MFGIKIGDHFLELDPSAQFTFDAEHPAFIDDFTQGDNGYPLEFPAQGKNQIMLAIPGDLQAVERIYEFDVEIYLFDNFWKKGRLTIDRAGTIKHSGYIKAGIRAFASLEKFLREIDMGGEQVLGADADAVVAHANACTPYNYPDRDYCFPMVRNETFYGDENPDWEYFINRWDRTNQTFLKNVIGGPFDPINKDSLVPMPFVAAILKYIFAQEGYSIDGTWLAGAEAAQDYLYSARPLDSRGNHTARASVTGSPTFIVDETVPSYPRVPFNDDSTAPNQDPDNRFDITTGNHHYTVPTPAWYKVVFTITYQVDAFTPNNPATTAHRLHWGLFLDNIQVYSLTGGSAVAVGGTLTQSFTAILYANWGSSDDFNVRPTDVLGGTYGEYTILGSTIEITDLDAASFNTYALTMNLANHVPERSVKDFLEGFQIHYNTRFVLDEKLKKVFIDSKVQDLIGGGGIDNVDQYADPEHETEFIEDSVLKSIGFDWPSDDELLNDNFIASDPASSIGEFGTLDDFPTPTEAGKTALERATNLRYIVRLNSSSILEWQPLSDEYFDRVRDPDGKIEIKDPFCPLLMRIYDTAMTGEVLVPAINQEGDNPAFNLSDQKLESFRICKYLGASGLSTEEYPFATSQAFGLINGVWSAGRIQWNFTADGAELWSHYLEWEKILNVKDIFLKDFYFDANYIASLHGDIFHIRFPRTLSSTRILFKRLSFSITQDGIGPTKAAFIRLP